MRTIFSPITVAALATALWLAACGKKDDPPPAQAAPSVGASAPEQSLSKLGAYLQARGVAVSGPAVLEPAARDGRDSALAMIEKLAAKGDEQSKRQAEALRAQYEYGQLARDPQASEAQKKAALDKMVQTAQAVHRRDLSVQQPALQLPPEWAATHRVVRNAKEAELLVQVGDIDNLGFGWPENFDPFSGESTPVHRYPWKPEADDPSGTDRIMVNSGAAVLRKSQDGYSRDTDRPANLPQPLVIEFDPSGVKIQAALLQLFVDDFQAPVLNTQFRVTLDGRPAPDIEGTINKLNQTGPIGKLITIRLLPEYLGLLSDGKLEVLVDDPTGQMGDGFAFDFARLLINPKGFQYSGTVRGRIVDRANDQPIEGALASAANVRQATTGKEGRFELKEVPAGLVVVSGSHPDYVSQSEQADLLAGQTVEVLIRLERAKNDTLAQRLESSGKVDLYGIYFDTDKASLKKESEATLNQVLELLKGKPSLRLMIAGHTDSQAGDEYNLDLSQRRAQAVVAWLVGKGVEASRLQAQGLGESQPVADNASAAGRALNRRVEIKDLSR
jgi:outer membrane protein OmpA-like peptidoglycan-associated protein